MFDIKSFYEAKDVQDAVQALVNEPDAEVISGGTDVLIRVREGKDAGKALVSIHNIPELKGVNVLENGDLWIGAATAFSHITNDPLIQKLIPMLGEAVDMVGGPQHRNHRRKYLQWSYFCRFSFYHVDLKCQSDPSGTGRGENRSHLRVLYRSRTDRKSQRRGMYGLSHCKRGL